MEIGTGHQGREAELAALFGAAFTASDGAEEGAMVAGLARALMADTPDADIRTFAATGDGTAIGCAIFTRLRYPQDPRQVFLLSPMAVAPAHQRQGIGRALIAHALDALRAEGAAAAVTYGDPAYYGRSGFRQIAAADAAPPLPLSMPHGWLGLALDAEEFAPLAGPSHCVPALERPAIW